MKLLIKIHSESPFYLIRKCFSTWTGMEGVSKSIMAYIYINN